MNKIKVLIVDDSAIVRNVLSEKLSEKPNIEIVGTAPDPFVARNMIIQLKPDVITLDIEMPRMDGLTFLSKLMNYYPIPVIIVSSITTQDKSASIKALEMGAFDIVNKPGSSISVQDVTDEIAYKIEMAYKIKDTYIARRDLIQKHLNNLTKSAPITNTYLSLKNGASHGAQEEIPLPINSFSPLTPSHFVSAPVAIITDLAFTSLSPVFKTKGLTVKSTEVTLEGTNSAPKRTA